MLLTLLTAALAQENGVTLCSEYTPNFPLVPVETACSGIPEVDVRRVNACFTSCAGPEQEFRVAVVNRGGMDAFDVVVTISSPDGDLYVETIPELLSQETVQTEPLRIHPADFHPDTVARVEIFGPECSTFGNEVRLDTALWQRSWPEPAWDDDEDGHTDVFCGGDDCNDADPAIHPDAPEEPGTDRDCDGVLAPYPEKGCMTVQRSSWAVWLLAVVGVGVRRWLNRA